ncbi:MAG: hypothetical protein NDJ92_02215 [Thermoanaerobaculia bacterium]|nr:hypothetical protein [Thermoanaerobaculia bacterium]
MTSIKLRRTAIIVVIAASAALTAMGEEKLVLLPVNFGSRGAFGSEFRTELVIHNRGSVAVVLRGVDDICVLSACVDTDPYATVIPPGTTQTHFQNTGRPGQFIKVPVDSELEYNLRAHDISRSAYSLGTEIPVVPEDEFIEGPFSLLSVFNGDTARARIRVYGFEQGMVRVRIIEQYSGRVLEERSVELRIPTPAYFPEYGMEFMSSYGEIADLPFGADQALRIELESEALNGRVWAFATMTNNTSQEITLATPYRTTANSLPLEQPTRQAP